MHTPIWIVLIMLQCTYMPVRYQLSIQLLEKILNCIEFARFETQYRLVPNRLIWYQRTVQLTVWIVDQTPWKVFPRRGDAGEVIRSENGGLNRRQRH
jgi:hypothetical protein